MREQLLDGNAMTELRPDDGGASVGHLDILALDWAGIVEHLIPIIPEF